MWPLLLALSTLSHAQDTGCRQPEWVLNEASEHLDNFQVPDALNAVAEVDAAYGCSKRAEAELLARLWLVQGMAHMYSGAPEEAAEWFAAAARMKPGLWPAAYGDRRSYDEAAAQDLPGGSLTVAPFNQRFWLAIDGKPAVPPLNVPAGIHLVQLGRGSEPEAAFARMVRVPPGGKLMVKHTVEPSVDVVVDTGPVSSGDSAPPKPDVEVASGPSIDSDFELNCDDDTHPRWDEKSGGWICTTYDGSNTQAPLKWGFKSGIGNSMSDVGLGLGVRFEGDMSAHVAVGIIPLFQGPPYASPGVAAQFRKHYHAVYGYAEIAPLRGAAYGPAVGIGVERPLEGVLIDAGIGIGMVSWQGNPISPWVSWNFALGWNFGPKVQWKNPPAQALDGPAG